MGILLGLWLGIFVSYGITIFSVLPWQQTVIIRKIAKQHCNHYESRNDYENCVEGNKKEMVDYVNNPLVE